MSCDMPEDMPILSRHINWLSQATHLPTHCIAHGLCAQLGRLRSLLCVAIISYSSPPFSHYAIVYPEQPSCAQYHSPNFTLNGMNTVSSPLLPSHGYLPLPGPFDATPPFPMNFENALGPPYGGNGYILYPFPAAGVPPAGAADSSEATRISILDSAIGGVFTHIVNFHDHPIYPS